jgi:hypothetical protein
MPPLAAPEREYPAFHYLDNYQNFTFAADHLDHFPAHIRATCTDTAG